MDVVQTRIRLWIVWEGGGSWQFVRVGVLFRLTFVQCRQVPMYRSAVGTSATQLVNTWRWLVICGWINPQAVESSRPKFPYQESHDALDETYVGRGIMLGTA